MTLSVPSFLAAAISAFLPPPAAADCAFDQSDVFVADPLLLPLFDPELLELLELLLLHPANAIAAAATVPMTTDILCCIRTCSRPCRGLPAYADSRPRAVECCGP